MTSINLASHSTTQYVVDVQDPTGLVSAGDRVLVAQLVQAAGAHLSLWAPGAGTIDVRLIFDASTATARASSSYGAPTQIGVADGLAVYENVFEHELRTGVDLNGTAPDVTIWVSPNLGQFFLDPTLATNDDLVAGKSDFFSVILHELVHAVAMVGVRDFSGNLNGSSEMPFDLYVKMVDGAPYFTGPNAMEIFGGPVPLTPNNIFHYGSAAGDPSTLLGGLMNGVAVTAGYRYDLNALDVAIMRDCGVATSSSADARAELWGTAHGDALAASIASSIHALGGDDTIQGSSGSDLIYLGDGHSAIDAGAGVDIAVFSEVLSAFTLSQSSGQVTVAGAHSSTQVNNVERLQFNDGMIALDLAGDEAGGVAARLIVAVMGAGVLEDKEFFGQVLGYVDAGLSLEQLCAAAVSTGIVANQAGGPSNAAFVESVYRHVVGVSAPAQDASYFTHILDTGSMTQAQLLGFAVDHPLAHAWLASRTGISYTPDGSFEAPVFPNIELVGFMPTPL